MFCSVLKTEQNIFGTRIRTPELNFSPEKFSEAVPKPNVSGGEHLSRGRFLVPPPI
jgi:hypothetical protein